jgi:hypothetical protein
VKALSPVASWKGSLKQQGAYDIVSGMNHALSLAILWGRVGTTSETGHHKKGRRCGRSYQTHVHCHTGCSGWCNQTALTHKRKSESGERVRLMA